MCLEVSKIPQVRNTDGKKPKSFPKDVPKVQRLRKAITDFIVKGTHQENIFQLCPLTL